MSQKNYGRIVDAEIVSYTDKGNGVAVFCFDDGIQRQAEVPFALKGEKVCISLQGKYKGKYRARLEKITSSSPNRIEPRCAHFGLCGGCRWQNIEYAEQLAMKQRMVEKHFSGLLDQVKVIPPIAADSLWEYRNKMEFSFSQDRRGERYFGLVQSGPYRDVFSLAECHLCLPWVVKCSHVIRAWWERSGLHAFHPKKNTGSLRSVVFRSGMRTGDRQVILQVSGNADFALSKQQLTEFVEACKTEANPEGKGNLSIFLRICQAVRGKPTTYFDMQLFGEKGFEEELTIAFAEGSKTLKFQVSPGAFFQPNTFQAEKLYGLALDLANIQPEDHVFDLYCGTGTLAIAAAAKGVRVTGVELSCESSHDARENAKYNQLTNVEIITNSVEEQAKILHSQGLRPDVVFIDPPRAGLVPKALTDVAAFNAPTLVYISCNPTTQAQNVRQLLQYGYRLVSMQAVDQFAHTAHIENVVLLQKERVH